MKRWAIITVTLYALLLLFITVPAILICCVQWDPGSQGPQGWVFALSPQDALAWMQHWGYWLWLLVFVSPQALLLVVPVQIAGQRPTSRRHLLIPVVTGAFLLGNLCMGGVLALIAPFRSDQIDKIFEAPISATEKMIQIIPGLAPTLDRVGLMPDSYGLVILHMLGLVGLCWMVWGFSFHHFAKADEADTIVQRTTRWLIRGSILEPLVAVPSHIVIRQRQDCCAPFRSFWGIVTGISVMLMSFGPAVLFPYAQRMRRKQPRPAQV